MDTGPSCKELGLFNKYNCFSFDLHVCRLILESERPIPDLRVPWAIFSPKTNSYLSKLVTWILKLRDIFAKTLAWFVSPWKSVRPIPVFRWAWWVVFQHGRLSWAPPSWILNSIPDWLKFVAAILDLENNRGYCSRNNSLLSFSAPDWLPVIWAWYSSTSSLKKGNL